MKKNIDHGPQMDKGLRDWRFLPLFPIFILIIGFFIITFFWDFSFPDITGYSIGNFGNDFNLNKSMEFSAEITTPSLELKGEYEKIEFSGVSDGILSTSNQNFDLSKQGRVFVTLNDFEGKIYFDSDRITKLEGKAEILNLNGVDISSKSGELKVSFEKSFDYDSLEISEGVFIDELNYISSGEVEIEKRNDFDLEKEEIFIDNFYGSLNSDEEKTSFNGYVELFEIRGDSKISVSK